MARPPVPIHYLRPNHAESTPGHVIFLDTETGVVPNSNPEVLALRLWAAQLVDRRPTRSGRAETVDGYGVNSAELLDWITQQCKGRQSIWLFAHNLSFDLVTTRLPLALVADGWRITDAAVGGRAPWMRFARGSHHLSLVDSGSWLPMALDQIGRFIGMTKPSLPADSDSFGAWLTRCKADVAILAAAMLQVMGWWDENALGRFTITGAACGWNAFRHMPTMSRICIDPDPAAVAQDRHGVHGGRRGVWKVGDINVGTLLELDFTAAYPMVASHLPLPLRRGIGFDTLPLSDRRVTSDRWGIAAEVEIETDTPLYPVRWSGQTWYPTGRFKAHLNGPEIAEAARLGVLRAIGPGQVHQLGHAMLPWAQWVIAVQSGQVADTPPAAMLVAKQWGRSVIGKWAGHAFVRTELGPSPISGWGYEDGWDHTSKTRGGMLDIGGRRWWVAAAAEPDNAYPAIMGWVESHVRLRLSRILAALGENGAIQCDTDGLIVKEESLIEWAVDRMAGKRADRTDRAWIDSALAALNDLVSPLVLRVKRQYNTATVLGPQHVETPAERRFSGLPKHATRNTEGKYVGKLWPKLQWQIGNGDERGYVRPDFESEVRGPFANGWVTATGRVIPPRAMIDNDGNTQILPWEFMPMKYRETRLAPRQHLALERIMT